MSERQISNPLLHLAVLETLKKDEIQDELDLFLPFIAVTASEIGKQVISDEDIQNKLLESFGFKPPLSAVRVLMTRAKNKGLFIKENHAFIPCHVKIEDWKNGFEDKQDDVSESLKNLKNDFKEFTYDSFKKQLTDSESEKLIFDFIESNVSSVISDKAYRNSGINGIKNADHLVASFISYIHKNKAATLNDFGRCVKGMLLANYLFYADKTANKKSYKNITVYLDSPIILGLLGFSGRQSKESYKDFVVLLKSLDINIHIFDKTLDEIEGLLRAWQSDLSKNRYNRFNTKTLEWLRAEGYDAERLDTEIKMLASDISKHGIDIKFGFSHKKQFQCDEVKLENAIAKRFTIHKNYEHDTVCISRIHNLRQGKVITTLDQDLTIFVTRNVPLLKVARDFFGDEFGKQSIPLVVSEQWMTSMFWLKKPDICANLPQEQLLSTAYSLLYTDDKFWESFLSRLERLQKRGGITEEDYLRIRWDSDLLRLVHNISVDVGEDFSEEDIFDVVAKINEKHTMKHLAEIDAIQREADEKLGASEREKLQAQDKITKLEGSVKKLSSFLGALIAWVITCLLITAVILVGLKSVPIDTQPNIFKSEFFRSYWFYIAVFTTLVLGLLASAFGFSLAFYHKKIKSWIEAKLMKLFFEF